MSSARDTTKTNRTRTGEFTTVVLNSEPEIAESCITTRNDRGCGKGRLTWPPRGSEVRRTF